MKEYWPNLEICWIFIVVSCHLEPAAYDGLFVSAASNKTILLVLAGFFHAGPIAWNNLFIYIYIFFCLFNIFDTTEFIQKVFDNKYYEYLQNV